MAIEIVMPRQGNTVESCIILSWKKHEGDVVKAGETLCEVETDKATFEVAAPRDGTLLRLVHAEGDDVPVLALIAVVGTPGEDIGTIVAQAGNSGVGGNAGAAGNGAGASPAGAPGGVDRAGASGAGGGASAGRTVALIGANGAAAGTQVSGVDPHIAAPRSRAVSPRARNLADSRGIDPAGLRGTGPGGRVIERDVLSVLETAGIPTPAAVAAIRAGGSFAPGSGTGIGGRVRAVDVAAAPSGGAAGSVGAVGDAVAGRPWADAAMSRLSAARTEGGVAPLGGDAFPGPVTEIVVGGVRKRTGERMRASLQTTAQLTLDTSADARGILEYRKALKASDPALGLDGVNLNDMILFAAARTLSAYPSLNAHFLGERILQFERVHLGFAVDTPRGLMVPVIRSADTLSLREVSAEAKRLAASCQAGKVQPDELQGGTFTVTNLGALGIVHFTPVLNTPQAAILGVGSVQLKPVEIEGEVRFIPHIGLSLTMDHQAVDGAPAARFLAALCRSIASFELVLAG